MNDTMKLFNIEYEPALLGVEEPPVYNVTLDAKGLAEFIIRNAYNKEILIRSVTEIWWI